MQSMNASLSKRFQKSNKKKIESVMPHPHFIENHGDACRILIAKIHGTFFLKRAVMDNNHTIEWNARNKFHFSQVKRSSLGM